MYCLQLLLYLSYDVPCLVRIQVLLYNTYKYDTLLVVDKYHQDLGDGADTQHVHGDSHLHGRACKPQIHASSFRDMKTKSNLLVP